MLQQCTCNFEALDFFLLKLSGNKCTPEETKLLPRYVSFKSSLCACPFFNVVLRDLEQFQLAATALARKSAFLRLLVYQREVDLFPCHAAASQDLKPLGKQCLLFYP